MFPFDNVLIEQQVVCVLQKVYGRVLFLRKEVKTPGVDIFIITKLY